VYKYPRREPSHLLDRIRRVFNSNEGRRRAASRSRKSICWLILICASYFNPRIAPVATLHHYIAPDLRSPFGSEPKPHHLSSSAPRNVLVMGGVAVTCLVLVIGWDMRLGAKHLVVQVRSYDGFVRSDGSLKMSDPRRVGSWEWSLPLVA
jgi:hypothetical protein